MFREGKIDEDTVDCPRFVAFKGASREDSSSSFNLGQLTKRIHGESDEFDEEEARQAQRKDRRRWAPFYLESPIGFTFTWNRPLCAVLMLGGGGGGVRDSTELTVDMNFAFSSMPNDMYAEERQARLERELKWCKSEESEKAHRSKPTSCLDPLQSKLGFLINQSTERAARAAPNGVKKGATFLLVFRCLNHTASPRKAFNGVQKGHVHSKKHKPSKTYICWRSTPGSPGAGLNNDRLSDHDEPIS